MRDFPADASYFEGLPDMKILPPVSIEARRLLPSRWDLLAAILVLGFIIAFADASRFLVQPLSSITGHELFLNPWDLPGYALRTGLRMLIAMGVSLAFTFSYATWAAKKTRRAGTLLVPLLDILQSVPILGFPVGDGGVVPVAVAGRVFGAELACVFAIFTSQAWNMAFSFYQSLRTVPPELDEAGRMFGLSAWARFWRIEAPFATPAADLEHDDEHVGRLVLRHRFRGDQRGQDQHRPCPASAPGSRSPSPRRTCPPSSRPSAPCWW